MKIKNISVSFLAVLTIARLQPLTAIAIQLEEEAMVVQEKPEVSVVETNGIESEIEGGIEETELLENDEQVSVKGTETETSVQRPDIQSIPDEMTQPVYESQTIPVQDGLLVELDDLRYQIENGSATVIGRSVGSNATSLVIPSVILSGMSWLTVDAIGAGAFQYTGITSITIPKSILSIGDYSFQGNNLTEISLPESLRTIGTYAFENNVISQVTIPNLVTSIGQHSFAKNSIEELVIGASITEIPSRAFSENKLIDLTIPMTVSSIGIGAFYQNSLASVVFPSALSNVGAFAFETNKLKSVSFFGDAPEIGMGSFMNNPLETINVYSKGIETYKQRLTTTAMMGVSKQTVLQSMDGEGPSYGEEITAVTTRRLGSLMEFRVVPERKYQIQSVSNLIWSQVQTEVQWYHNNILIENENALVLRLMMADESSGGMYHVIVDGVLLDPLQLIVTLDERPEIPSIDPNNPTLTPENTNPNEGALAIRHVSSMDFGSTPFKNSSQTLYTEHENELDQMITIQDMRTKGNRSGWELTVKQDGNFMNGATLKMRPYLNEGNDGSGISMYAGILELSDTPQRFAHAPTGNPFGIVSMGLATPDSQGVELEIPSGAGVGIYATTVTWNLISSP